MKKEADKLLTKLDEENYIKFKEYNLNMEKKQFKIYFFNIESMVKIFIFRIVNGI